MPQLRKLVRGQCARTLWVRAGCRQAKGRRTEPRVPARTGDPGAIPGGRPAAAAAGRMACCDPADGAAALLPLIDRAPRGAARASRKRRRS